MPSFSPEIAVVEPAAHYAGFFKIFMASNSAELRSLLLTIHTYLLRNLPQTLCLVDVAGIIHSSVGEKNVALSFWHVNMSGKIPCFAADASLLSFSLFFRSVLKFHSVATSLMRKFDYFSKR